ncbi:hypothetical protein HZH68_010951 [Vespula germanica]|uniref:Uncharacterized protein n=1 Tax=Vespula germanica TaxID=30212 RepID=A0A834JTM7_VESGE|nr:hypothetical protein HZH68_010951 [Vespula germanica]
MFVNQSFSIGNRNENEQTSERRREDGKCVLVNTIAIAPGESCSIRTFNPSRRLEKFRAERNPISRTLGTTSTNLDTKSKDFKGDESRINPQSKLILVDILPLCSHN